MVDDDTFLNIFSLILTHMHLKALAFGQCYERTMNQTMSQDSPHGDICYPFLIETYVQVERG
jgi:hypothetical protein